MDNGIEFLYLPLYFSAILLVMCIQLCFELCVRASPFYTLMIVRQNLYILKQSIEEKITERKNGEQASGHN